MSEFRKPAIRIEQGKRDLFLCSFTVREFQSDGFYRVDRLDINEDTGMQRLLHAARAKSLANDIVGAHKQQEEFLPTSVFLATEGEIHYDNEKKELFFSTDSSVCPFDVVDGQHRIEGMRIAAGRDTALLDFPISVVIAHKMSEAEKMLHFLVVNTKQEPVNPGVTQFITAKFTKMHEVKKLPYIPIWLQRKVEKGDDDTALRLVIELNNDKESPWYRRIHLADSPKEPQHVINQATFVKNVKRVLLARNHPYSGMPNSVANKRYQIIKNYWIAVNNICGGSDHKKTAIFKSVGLEFFHPVFGQIFNILARDRNYTVEKYEEVLRSAEEYLPPEVAGILNYEFWKTGGDIGTFNRSKMEQLASKFSTALMEANNQIEDL